MLFQVAKGSYSLQMRVGINYITCVVCVVLLLSRGPNRLWEAQGNSHPLSTATHLSQKGPQSLSRSSWERDYIRSLPQIGRAHV